VAAGVALPEGALARTDGDLEAAPGAKVDGGL